MDLYLKNALDCSRKTTLNYSTSFSLGVRSLDYETQKAIYAIYGFVRFADEIVDTFFEQDQEAVFREFVQQTDEAIATSFSTNPILHSFQWVVHTYDIAQEYIDAFLKSMEMDLKLTVHDQKSFDTYVYGSAEAVGLMCLCVFCAGDREKFNRLVNPARKLGSAFQKINFLRDLKDDFKDRGRNYFPGVDFDHFDDALKHQLEDEIQAEFDEAFEGIKALQPSVRLGVLLAYTYYKELLFKIRRTPAESIMNKRCRISDQYKMWLLFKVVVKNQIYSI
ncbi:phytoene/squalene synthase family protein [Saccharicrinis sp. FJH54]|uniref:phytoene/squalene synthase family protein n=1 Tax=Saccharicrinis sp. FJH54 TaxID=3344665 RepID=UPI0035D476EB